VETTASTPFIVAMSTLIGAAAPIMARFIIDFFTARKKAENDVIQQQFAALSKERVELAAIQQTMTVDMQKQIFDLRGQLIELQKANMIITQENVTLNTKILTLSDENITLKVRIAELELEVKKLQEIINNYAINKHSTT
jgi:hypothetical protein